MVKPAEKTWGTAYVPFRSCDFEPGLIEEKQLVTAEGHADRSLRFTAPMASPKGRHGHTKENSSTAAKG